MKLLRISNFFWLIIVIAALLLNLKYAFISPDAAFYIPVARDISGGLVLYKDIQCSYTPIMMVLNSLIFNIISQPPYHVFIIFQYLVIITSLVFLFFICSKLKLDKTRTFFILLFIFISVLSSDGTYINLEVYVFLFVMGAFWFLLKGEYFWAGVFLSLSVFSKQYAILNFLPFGLLMIHQIGLNKKPWFSFVFGASLPLIVFLIYFSLLEDVPLIALIKQLGGGSYASSGLASDKSLKGLLIDGKVFILMVLPFLFMKWNFLRSDISKILFVGVIVNLIPLFIQNFQHYFILSFPYLALLLAYNINFSTTKTYIAVNFSMLLISAFLFARIERYQDNWSIQTKISQKYINDYPAGSEVFLDRHIRFLYIMNNYKNPVVSNVGYSFRFVPDSAFRATYVVLPTKELNQ